MILTFFQLSCEDFMIWPLPYTPLHASATGAEWVAYLPAAKLEANDSCNCHTCLTQRLISQNTFNLLLPHLHYPPQPHPHAVVAACLSKAEASEVGHFRVHGA